MNRTFPVRSVQLDPDEAQLAYSTIVTKKYFCVALLAALIYHSILTVKEEVRYFWPKSFNHISLVYFMNRYLGLFAAVSAVAGNGFSQNLRSCELWNAGVGICTLVTVLLTDYILVIRVLALYQQDKKLSVILNGLLVMETAVSLSFLLYGMITAKVVVFVEPNLFSLCGSLRGPPTTVGIASWVLPLAFGFLLLSLSVYKAVEYWKLSSRLQGFHLLEVLIRDQVLYYGLVIFCCILKIAANAIFVTNSFVAELVNLAGSPTLLCILGGQLLINLKQAGELGVNGGTNYRSRTVSEIDFAEAPAAVEAPPARSIAASEV